MRAVPGRGSRTSPPRSLGAPGALPAPLPRHPAHSGLGARSPRRISAFRASVSRPRAAARAREGLRPGRGRCREAADSQACATASWHTHGMQRASLELAWEGRAGAQAKQVCSPFVAVASEAGGDLRGRFRLVTAVSRSQAGPILSKVTADSPSRPPRMHTPGAAHSPGWAPKDAPLAPPASGDPPPTPVPGFPGVSPCAPVVQRLPSSSLARSPPPSPAPGVCVSLILRGCSFVTNCFYAPRPRCE